jgi:hypothetical protein
METLRAGADPSELEAAWAAGRALDVAGAIAFAIGGVTYPAPGVSAAE